MDKFKTLEKIMEPWSLSTLTMTKQIKRKLDKHSITWDEFIAYVDNRHQHERIIKSHHNRMSKVIRFAMMCPECNNPMIIMGDPDNESCSVWICKKCRFSKYVNRPAKEEVESLFASSKLMTLKNKQIQKEGIE